MLECDGVCMELLHDRCCVLYSQDFNARGVGGWAVDKGPSTVMHQPFGFDSDTKIEELAGGLRKGV